MCGSFYKTDCEDLTLDCHNKSYCDFWKLKYFSSLDYLYIDSLDTDSEISIPNVVNLNSINFSNCNIKNNSFSGISKNIDELYFIGTNIDFSEFSNDNIKKLNFILGSIDNFDKIGIYSKAEYLYLHGTEFQGLKRVSNLIVTYEMYDSSFFSAFDRVKILEIYQTRIKDISGFLNMKSLEEIHLWEGYISTEYVSELENAGIMVCLHETKY